MLARTLRTLARTTTLVGLVAMAALSSGCSDSEGEARSGDPALPAAAESDPFANAHPRMRALVHLLRQHPSDGFPRREDVVWEWVATLPVVVLLSVDQLERRTPVVGWEHAVLELRTWYGWTEGPRAPYGSGLHWCVLSRLTRAPLSELLPLWPGGREVVGGALDVELATPMVLAEGVPFCCSALSELGPVRNPGQGGGAIPQNGVDEFHPVVRDAGGLDARALAGADLSVEDLVAGARVARLDLSRANSLPVSLETPFHQIRHQLLVSSVLLLMLDASDDPERVAALLARYEELRAREDLSDEELDRALLELAAE